MLERIGIQLVTNEPRKAKKTLGGFEGPPADGGLSIDRLAQAFAAMMGEQDPYGSATQGTQEVVEIDASPDLDETVNAADTPQTPTCRVNPQSILEALLFVGLPDGQPLSSEKVASLMRGVRSSEIDEFARDLAHHYEINGCPYEVVSEGSGWILRLRKEFRQYGAVLEAKTRRVRLDAGALDALAVVAWNQPVAREDLTRLGCDTTPAVMRQLVRRGLLELVKLPRGQIDTQEEVPCYRTTPRFLEVFQLRSLSDLPDPHEPPR